ncbi:MAG: hypothetical protein U0893_17575 [Chloroflexota bacterium]
MKRIAVLIGFVVVALVSALAPPGHPIEAQQNCFQETGFCITTPQFADYFRQRGGSKTLGFPVSRTFTLEGFQVQFFQRVVLQLQGNTVNRLNLLDPSIMPMTRVNQSQFPPNDPQLASQAPQQSPTYAQDVVTFIKNASPNSFNGQNVNFFNTFNSAVPAEAAGGNADLLTLLNLEIWGLPTSKPAADPGNGGFIYQRYQRGIMHFDASCGCTQGILVGEYFKAVITGKNLPTDLASDMQSSRFMGQYNPANQNWLNRPGDLQNTDLTGAFEPGTGNVQPGTGQPKPGNPTPAPTSAPAGTATATPAPAASTTVILQTDDDLIDPGQKLHVTVIARNTVGLDWIEWQGDDTGDPVLDERHRFQCDQNTECANAWDVIPTKPGRYTLRARARDKNNQTSDWVTRDLRIREGPTPTPTPSTPTPTPGPGTPTATPVPAASVPSVVLQLSDSSISLGESVEITVIAHHDKGLDWIQWYGDLSDDPALDKMRFDCDNKKDCTRTWTVKPTKKGSVDIVAEAKDQNGVRSAASRQELKVK